MVPSFFVRWAELRQKENNEVEESRTERNSEKSGNSCPLTPKSLPVSTLILSGGLTIFLPLDSVRQSVHSLFIVIYILFDPFLTHYHIQRVSVTTNMLGFTWSYDQIDYTLQLYSNWWDFLNSLCWCFTPFTQQRIRMDPKK